MTVLSIPLPGDKVGIYRWAAVFVGFLGMLVIVKPDGDVLQVGAVAAIGGAVLYALAVITVRHLSATESSASITFYYTLTAALVGIALVPRLVGCHRRRSIGCCSSALALSVGSDITV